MMVLLSMSSSNAIAHDGVTLNVLIERNGGYCLESPPTPEQAFQGLQQLAQFASLLQQSDNGLTARTQLLNQIRIIPLINPAM
jgi:hypothetical protein